MFTYDVTYMELKQSSFSEVSLFCKSEKVDFEYLVYTLKSLKKSCK